MKTRFTLIAVLLLVNTGASVFAQTNVSGIISSNTTWTLANSPYIVTGNIILNNGYTLTIQPGVTVRFNSGLSMQIDGMLLAQGTNSDSITFTSNTVDTAGAWGYIYFSDVSTDAVFQNNIYGNYISGSILEYCKIQYAGGANISYNGALRLDGAHPFINYCTISYNKASGINANNLTDSLKITNSVISHNISPNTGGGIFIAGFAIVLIDGNTIAYNVVTDIFGFGGGISSAYGAIIISNNKIFENIGGAGGGIGCGMGGASSQTITNNIIMNNIANSTGIGGGGIFVGSGDATTISGNTITGNKAQRVSGIYSGGDASWGSVTNISSNIIADNVSEFEGGGLSDKNAHNSPAIFYNHIVRNLATDMSGFMLGDNYQSFQNVKYNTVAYNINTDYHDTLNRSIYVISEPAMNFNNIFNNTAYYELYNDNAQTTPNVDATFNWWSTSNNATILEGIYDWIDNNTLGIVNYSPYLTKPDTAAPVSPPYKVTKIDLGGGQIKIKWQQNPESDVTGYHIYYGNFTGYSFTNMIDVVGKADTSYILSGVTVGDTIAVTAYDIVYNPANENVSTITNDNMTNGNESWYTYAIGKPTPVFSATPVSVCPTDIVYFTDNTPVSYSYANTTWAWSFPGGMPSVSNLQNPNIVYNTSGTYNVKLKMTNIAGSDSLTYINYITVKNQSYATISPHVCNTGSYNSPSGVYTWYSDGTYHDTIPNYAGCDSILTIHLTLSNDSYNTINPDACDSFTSPSGNYTWYNSGNYYDTIPNTSGCDSIFTINLTVYNIDTSITFTGGVLTANAASASYQWLDCGNGYSIITGETNQSFTPLVNGDYAVQIMQSICMDTSSCYNVVVSGINALNDDNTFEIFPNPASDYVVLKFNNLGNENLRLNIYNVIGELISSETLRQNQQQINVGDLSNGIYMIEIKSKERTEKQKLIIQR